MVDYPFKIGYCANWTAACLSRLPRGDLVKGSLSSDPFSRHGGLLIDGLLFPEVRE